MAKKNGKAPAKKAGPKGERKPRAPGVGTLAKEMILAGKSTEQILAAVQKKFPDASTTEKGISFYRNALRKEGHDIPRANAGKDDPTK